MIEKYFPNVREKTLTIDFRKEIKIPLYVMFYPVYFGRNAFPTSSYFNVQCISALLDKQFKTIQMHIQFNVI